MKKKFDTKKFKRLEKLIEDLSLKLNKNSIKLLDWALSEMLVRQQLLVTEHTVYCICPRCYETLPRDYVAYCDRCGQCLKWQSMKKVSYVSYEEIQERVFAETPAKTEILHNSTTIVRNIFYFIEKA